MGRSSYGSGMSLMSCNCTSFNRARSAMAASFLALPRIMQEEITTGVQGALREVLVEGVANVTPVVTGNLQRSTQAVVTISDGVWTIKVDQPATSASGEQYAGYVIRGHMTMEQVWVPGNDYPTRAWRDIATPVRRLLSEVGRRIAMRTVVIMATGQGGI